VNAPAKKTDVIALAQIVREPSLNCRADGLNEATAIEYSEAIAAGAKLPPVTVYFDGERYLLADGFHRCRAHELAGKAEIECAVHRGGEREARLFSVGCNAAHGLRRTTADKVRAVTLLLLDGEWSRKSDRWIADTCGVGHPFVAKLRGQVESDSTATREGRDGKQQSATKAKKPKKGRKAFDAGRAAKGARRALEQVAKKWPNGEPIGPLLEAVQAWLGSVESSSVPTKGGAT
jgi:hypothetical protein